MARVTYVGADGTRTTVEVPAGDTVMDGALDHNIPGIIGQCGGGCTCSTCHCYVAPPWRSRVPAAAVDELALLEYAIDWRPSSRLACQIRVTEALDGLVVALPERQLP
ncbi:MAG: 2Fe-2S iron-sulfur cluster-binding protein [Pseudomonadales bacterium]